jgi:hypothetical protein
MSKAVRASTSLSILGVRTLKLSKVSGLPG